MERLKLIGKWHGLPRLTLKEWIEKWDQFDHRCAYCLERFAELRDVTIEHLVGIREGGTHRKDNVVPACLKCNQTKGTKTVEEFTSRSVEEFLVEQLKKIEELKQQ